MQKAKVCNGQLRDIKTEKLACLARKFTNQKIDKVLVVGCGYGIEAAVLARELNAEVIGIDLNSSFCTEAQSYAVLQIGDATSLQFEDQYFDFVYSYHALEHIANYQKALKEMRRVLCNTGTYLIGTPNRSRIIGYLVSKSASSRQKLAWNISDWGARLRGKFRNECGAHAGFTEFELRNDLQRVFSQAVEITNEYYRNLYQDYNFLLKLIINFGLDRMLFPSIYFLGNK